MEKVVPRTDSEQDSQIGGVQKNWFQFQKLFFKVLISHAAIRNHKKREALFIWFPHFFSCSIRFSLLFKMTDEDRRHFGRDKTEEIITHNFSPRCSSVLWFSGEMEERLQVNYKDLVMRTQQKSNKTELLAKARKKWRVKRKKKKKRLNENRVVWCFASKS